MSLSSSTKNNTSSLSPHFWAVIPAAGVGARMASDRPKQYLPLAGRTVIEHSLNAMLNHPAIKGVVLAIATDDEYWAALDYQHPKPVLRAPGGTERCHSVLNALDVLQTMASEADWVLVHDAARPCLRQDDISQLMECCKHHPVGGILAVPVKDTIKQSMDSSQAGTIAVTVDRSLLWHAQTPQMFRLGMLRDALRQALAAGVTMTDEASALEWCGQMPLLVEGHGDNIKITRPEDLPLAAFYFSRLRLADGT